MFFNGSKIPTRVQCRIPQGTLILCLVLIGQVVSEEIVHNDWCQVMAIAHMAFSKVSWKKVTFLQNLQVLFSIQLDNKDVIECVYFTLALYYVLRQAELGFEYLYVEYALPLPRTAILYQYNCLQTIYRSNTKKKNNAIII